MSDTTYPRVSVLLPVYNGQRYIDEAVSSILAQTFGDFEFIIIDDGSTDRTPSILDRFARSDVRVRVYRRANTGYARALNEALQLATGEYAARMDADDVSMPDRFEHQVKYLDRHHECVVVGTQVLAIDPAGWPIGPHHYPVTHKQIDAALLRHAGSMCHPAVMMRRSEVLAAGGYHEHLMPAEDYDLWLRLADEHRLANLPEVLVKYRYHFASESRSKRERQRDHAQVAMRKAFVRRGLDPADMPAIRLGPSKAKWEHRRQWARWALMNGHCWTARKHALAAWSQRPWSVAGARLFIKSMLGSRFDEKRRKRAEQRQASTVSSTD